MKISPGKLGHFLAKPDTDFIAALIYGPDTGQVHQNSEMLSKTIVGDLSDPFRIIDLPNEKLKEDAAILTDEMSAIPFGGGKKLVRVRDAQDNIADNINQALLSLNKDICENSFAIFIAGELDAKSKLRKIFESNHCLAAIACYQDDERGLRPVIINEMKKYGLAADNDAVQLFAEFCRGDRLIVQKEMEKLALFLGEKKKVEYGDVRAIIGETTESSYDNICEAIISGNQAMLEKHLRKALMQGEMPIVILRTVQRYFSRLHFTIGMVANGLSVEEAIASLKPPVFFKHLPFFKQQVMTWRGERSKSLWKIMELLYQAELESKKTGSDAELICSRYLMRIASLGKITNPV